MAEAHEVLAAGDGWQAKCIKRSRGTQTIIGSIVIAALGKSMMVPSRKQIFTGYARIDRDGVVRATMIDKYGVVNPDYAIMRVKDLSDALTRLANDCGLNDTEAVDLFKQVRGWIARDDTANSGEPIQ